MLAKACALVLEDYPVVNARYEPGQTVYQKDINVAMAVAIDGGLITPTLKVPAPFAASLPCELVGGGWFVAGVRVCMFFAPGFCSWLGL